MAALLVIAAGNLALAGTIAKPSAPDPLLNGTPGPCAGLVAGADYAANTDAAGNPVIPADVAATPVPVPDSIAIPLHRGGQRLNPATPNGPYVTLDGKRLAPLMSPPTCGR